MTRVTRAVLCAAGVVRVHLHSSAQWSCVNRSGPARAHKARAGLCTDVGPRTCVSRPLCRATAAAPRRRHPCGSGVSSSATSSGSASTGSHSCVHASRGLRVGEMLALCAGMRPHRHGGNDCLVALRLRSSARLCERCVRDGAFAISSSRGLKIAWRTCSRTSDAHGVAVAGETRALLQLQHASAPRRASAVRRCQRRLGSLPCRVQFGQSERHAPLVFRLPSRAQPGAAA